MSLFGSVTKLYVNNDKYKEDPKLGAKLSEEDIAHNLNLAPGHGLSKPDTVDFSSTIVKGLAIAGIGAGIIGYLKNPSASLNVAKGISKVFNINPTSVVRNNSGVYKEALVGTASDLVVLASNISNINKKVLPDILNELKRSTYQDIKEGDKQATINTLLKELRQSKKSKKVKTPYDVLNKALSTIEKQGIDKDKLLNVALGKNILSEGGKIADYRRFTLGGLGKRFLDYGHTNLQIPFIGFAPTDLLMGNAFVHTRSLVNLGSKIKVRGKELGSKSVLVGNKIFTEEGKVIEGNFKRIRTNSALSTSVAIVTDQYKLKSLDELVELNNSKGVRNYLTSFLKNRKWAGMSQKAKDKIARRAKEIQFSFDAKDIGFKEFKQQVSELVGTVGKEGSTFENLFISPKYSSHPGVASEIKDWFTRITSGTSTLRRNANNDIIRDLETDPLTIMESIKEKLKLDVRGINYTDEAGDVIGRKTLGPKKSFGFEDYVEGIHDPENIVQGFSKVAETPKIPTEFTVVEGGDSVLSSIFTSDAGRSVGHFLASRPANILETLTGLGVRPDPSVLKTLLYSSVGIYAASEIVKNTVAYANFATFGLPAKAAAAVIGTGQVATQAAFTATGISTLSESLEDTLPGSVNSLASQITRVTAAPFLGAYLGEKFIPNGINLDKLAFWKNLGKDTASAVSSNIIKGRTAGGLIAASIAIATVFLDPSKGVVQQYEESTGKSRVAIRNARWWFAGRSDYAGSNIKYFDQSMVQKLYHYNAGDKTTYGSEGAEWMHSWFPTPSNLFGVMPLINPYWLEKRNQDYRPYPEIAPVGNNLPLIGPAFAATIGQIIKPKITTDITSDTGSSIQPDTYGRYGTTTSEGSRLGYDTSVPTIEARSSTGAAAVANKTIDRAQDLLGAYGFLHKFVTNAFTGDETGFDANHELASSSTMTSQGKKLNDLNLGGLVGVTELARRLYNTDPNNVTYYNPIPNKMPRYLPGSNSFFTGDQQNSVDFTTGDAYSAIENGTTRLPGPGYEAINGYHGGKSPDILDVYSVLSDVAPGSEAAKYYNTIVTDMARKGQLDKSGKDIYNRVNTELSARRSGKYDFKDYYNETVQDPGPMGQLTKDYLGYTNVNIEQTPKNPLLAPIRQAWDTVTHTQIPGLAWAQGKFIHNRTPLEEYKATQVYGTEYADWLNPVQGFIKPALQEIRGAVQGASYIPSTVQKTNEIEEYYDKLKYLKSRRLQARAEVLNQGDLEQQYKKQQQQTIVGMQYTPGGVNKNIFKAVPASMRPFVSAFAKATPEEASKIKQYIPDYQKNMWDAIWQGNNVAQGETNNEPAQYRADQEVAEYFSQRSLPDPSSNIWNPDVNLEEYKLKTAEYEGVSYFQMGIPEAKARKFRSLGRADVLLDSSPFLEDMDHRQRLMTELARSGSYTDRIRPTSIRQTATVQYNGQENMRSRYNTYTGRF